MGSLLEEKRKLQSKPLPFQGVNRPLIAGAKPIAGDSFAVKAMPVETTTIPPFEKRRKALA